MNLPAYNAALHGAVYYVQQDIGFLRFTGADRVDFLQRQTTNDLRLLTPDRAVSTVLISPTARILDVLCVIDGTESLGVIPLPGKGNQTFDFLRKRIFFSDQVSIEDQSTDFAQILLFGPKSGSVLEDLGLSIPELDHLINGEISGQPVTLIGQRIHGGVGSRLLLPTPSVDVVIEKLDKAGAHSIAPGIFESLRVEAGQPGAFNELTEEYTPLEVNLGEMISDSKGCYTGQEIIARQITYDKITKNLVGIKLSEPVSIGAKIEVNGKVTGSLTSVVQSPRFGSIGLGVIRRQYLEFGTSVSIKKEDNSIVDGEIRELPFR